MIIIIICFITTTGTTENDYILCTKIIRTLSSSFIKSSTSYNHKNNYNNNNNNTKHYNNSHNNKNVISYYAAETSENILERIILEIEKQSVNNNNTILHIENIQDTIRKLYNRCIKALAFCYDTNSQVTEEMILYKSYSILERMKLRYELEQQEQ